IPYRPNSGTAGLRPQSATSSLDVSVRRNPHAYTTLNNVASRYAANAPLRLACPHRAVDPTVGVIQKPLQLLPGERTRLRAALVIVQMRDRVPLVADRHRVHTPPELLLAGHHPPIPTVAQVLAEQPQIRLIPTNRRRRQMLLTGQRERPLIHLRRPPIPRVLTSEIHEPADQPLPRNDGVLLQPTSRLLSPPPLQHRLHHGVLRPQMHHTGDQLQMRGTPQITPSHPCLQPRSPRPFEARIMHLPGSPGQHRRPNG